MQLLKSWWEMKKPQNGNNVWNLMKRISYELVSKTFTPKCKSMVEGCAEGKLPSPRPWVEEGTPHSPPPPAKLTKSSWCKHSISSRQQYALSLPFINAFQFLVFCFYFIITFLCVIIVRTANPNFQGGQPAAALRPSPSVETVAEQTSRILHKAIE